MRDSPPLKGRQLIEFKSIISGIEADLEQYENALKIFGAPAGAPVSDPAHSKSTPLTSQIGDRCPDADQNGAHAVTRPAVNPVPVRVLLTGVPLVHGAERVLELIEEAGAVVVAMENCTGLKPILDDVDLDEPDILRAIARKYYHLPCSVMTPNSQRFETLRSLAEKFRPHCIIELVWQACLTYDIESLQVRKLAEEEMHLPYLKITTDYSPSDSARISARVEALFETIRARLAAEFRA